MHRWFNYINASGASHTVGMVKPRKALVSPQLTHVCVTGTDVNGCTSLDTVGVTVNPLPTVYLGNDTTSICQGDSVY